MPAPSRGLAAEAYRRITDMILRGTLPMGAPLQEARLGAALGMSRTPVREAIARIESEGLALRHGRILRVGDLTPAEVEGIFVLRLDLEPFAAEGATGLPAARLDAMEARVRALLDARSAEDLWAVDNDFHAMLAGAANNRAVAEVIADLRRRTTMFDHAQVPDRYRLGCEEHLGILDALRAGDGAEAAARMRAHLERARDAILARMREVRAHGPEGRPA
ncbi:GntR family transcriptional regulator [Falsirhodobacter halotolerans]|uniref:GntR family transcriptional regulator n=1 Tax=Falsirhodobacter halotolerans TaxID=1146892 RepID=UPI001FD016D3|nr:GntR family transcriptional regulator [Falsirhodobacter halotolerans]MCJ8140871.1 GntR family transcriptional regulator [Falsirhodobacter halotolerans]